MFLWYRVWWRAAEEQGGGMFPFEIHCQSGEHWGVEMGLLPLFLFSFPLFLSLHGILSHFFKQLGQLRPPQAAETMT